MALGVIEFTVTDDAGNVIAAPQVTVTRESSGAPGVPYADRDGVSSLGSPFTGGTGQGLAPGKVRFYIAGGAYRIDVTDGSFSDTYRHKAVGTFAEQDVGVAGAVPGVRLTFDSGTSAADPGDGKWRANHATFASITALYVDNLALGGSDITEWLDSIDDGATSAHRGYLRLETGSNPLQWAEFHVTGSVVDSTGYRTITVTPRDESGWPFTASTVQSATFERTGAAGAAGINGASALTAVRLAASSNVVIASALEQGDAIDGVTLVAGDMVLLTAQTAPAENGVYVAVSSGAASRHTSFDTYDEHPGCCFSVQEGDRNKNSIWQCTSARGGTIGVTALAISDIRDRSPYPPGFMYGCGVANNGSDATNDIDFASGFLRDQLNTRNGAATTQTKRLDADFATGTGNGMRYKGLAIANDTYHLYDVWTVTGTHDYYAFPSLGFSGGSSTDPDSSGAISQVLAAIQAETGGSAYVFARRRFSILRVSAAIKPFTQVSDEVLWTTPVLDVSNATPGTSANTGTLTSPLGLKCLVRLNCYFNATGGFYVSSLDQADLATSLSAAPLITTYDGGNANAAPSDVITNRSAQFRYRADSNNPVRVVSRSYVDVRGRLG